MKGGGVALAEFREKEMRRKSDATCSKSMLTEPGSTASATSTERVRVMANRQETRTGARTGTEARTRESPAAINAAVRVPVPVRVSTCTAAESNTRNVGRAKSAGECQNTHARRMHAQSATNRSDAGSSLRGNLAQLSPSLCRGISQRDLGWLPHSLHPDATEGTSPVYDTRGTAAPLNERSGPETPHTVPCKIRGNLQGC